MAASKTKPHRLTQEMTQPDLQQWESSEGRSARLVRLGSGSDRELVIPKREVIVGSAVDCDMWVDHETVSRHHFAIRKDGLAFLIRDLNSTNGTFMNGVRIREVYLQPGCAIRAGSVEFRFEVEP